MSSFRHKPAEDSIRVGLLESGVAAIIKHKRGPDGVWSYTNAVAVKKEKRKKKKEKRKKKLVRSRFYLHVAVVALSNAGKEDIEDWGLLCCWYRIIQNKKERKTIGKEKIGRGGARKQKIDWCFGCCWCRWLIYYMGWEIIYISSSSRRVEKRVAAAY